MSQHKSDIYLIDSLGEDYEISSTIEGSKQNYYCYNVETHGYDENDDDVRNFKLKTLFV